MSEEVKYIMCPNYSMDEIQQGRKWFDMESVIYGTLKGVCVNSIDKDLELKRSNGQVVNVRNEVYDMLKSNNEKTEQVSKEYIKNVKGKIEEYNKLFSNSKLEYTDRIRIILAKNEAYRSLIIGGIITCLGVAALAYISFFVI